MTPAALENEVLITFLRAGGSPLSIKTLHARMGARLLGIEEFIFSDVAKAVSRLLNLGHIQVQGEEQIGLQMYPAYSLSAAGIHAAHSAKHQQRAAALAGTAKPKTSPGGTH